MVRLYVLFLDPSEASCGADEDIHALLLERIKEQIDYHGDEVASIVSCQKALCHLSVLCINWPPIFGDCPENGLVFKTSRCLSSIDWRLHRISREWRESDGWRAMPRFIRAGKTSSL